VLPVICQQGIGDTFLILSRVPIRLLGKFGMRFNVFYTSVSHPALQAIVPFLENISYCTLLSRQPTSRELFLFSKLMSLSLRTNMLWTPPIDLHAKASKNGLNSGQKKILLHSHLDGHHGRKGINAKIWPISNWISLCSALHSLNYEVALLEYDAFSYDRIKIACPFVTDGIKASLHETVVSMAEYDLVFSIDSWTKYAAFWHKLPQVVVVPDLSVGFCGFEHLTADWVAKWWFQGIITDRNSKVIGLSKSENSYIYSLGNINNLTVDVAIDQIQHLTK